MRILVTGSRGHLGEALMRRLPEEGHEVVGLDLHDGPFVDVIGSVSDRAVVRGALEGVDAVLHTATLHKPHVASHTRHNFVEANISGTLTILEEAVLAGIGSVVFTSSTTTFGRALSPAAGEPAAWITEDVRPVPKNVYGATKVAAEDLCELVHRDEGLFVVILRTSRFFPEGDDVEDRRGGYDDLNLKVNELLHRRVDLEDVVQAHLRAIERAPAIGFGRYVISATTPFTQDDLADLRTDPAAVVARRCGSQAAEVFSARGWRMLPDIDRVYVNDAARRDLGWDPAFTFGAAIEALAAGRDPRSAVALAVGKKGYHERSTGIYTDGPTRRA